MKTRLTIVLSLLVASTLHAQTETQTLYWLRYQAVFFFYPKLSWSNEIDNRRFIGPDVQNQLIFHSRVHYRINRWDLGAGITYSLAYAGRPEAGYTQPTNELRPVIEATYEIPLRKAFLSQRLRLDNRIFQANQETSLFDESFYVLRFRYRIQFRTALKKNDANVTTIGLRVADEIMFNDRRNFFDQNRIYMTGDFYLSPGFSLEAGYIFIHQQRFGREDFFNRHVLRFSILHRITLAD